MAGQMTGRKLLISCHHLNIKVSGQYIPPDNANRIYTCQDNYFERINTLEWMWVSVGKIYECAILVGKSPKDLWHALFQLFLMFRFFFRFAI